jgi:hypothetical protein
MDDLLALDGDRAATEWQKRHAKRKALEARKNFALRCAPSKRPILRSVSRSGARKEMRPRQRPPFQQTHSAARCAQAMDRHDGLAIWASHRFARCSGFKEWWTACRRWWVKYDCGHAEHLVNGTNLRQGKVLSCSCLTREGMRQSWKSGKFAQRLAANRKLEEAPLSIRIAELRHRVLHKKRITRGDAKLLGLVRKELFS